MIFQALDGLTVTGDFVFQMGMDRSLKPKRVALRDYDCNHPRHELIARASANPRLAGTFEGYGTGDRRMVLNTEISVPAAITTEELEIYDHHDEYQESDVNRDHARIELEQNRRDARVASGQSVCQRLVPGYRFLLEDHPLRIFNKEFAVTRVEHWGQIPEWKPAYRGYAALAPTDPVQSLNYRNRFECFPAGIAFRMRRPERKLYQVTETATVVGPPGTEIHTDAQGRIKVHFHWDREAKCSCWLRVAQPWSGAGWGHQVIPRVGMEVVVTFLGGDLDKPLVTSCVPNAHHPMPFPLPSGTRSGVRTQSTPGGNSGEYNELSFEDLRGAEQIYLHAQKKLEEVVEGEHSTLVRGARRNEIYGNLSEEVRSHETSRVRLSRTRETGEDHHESIGGSFLQTIGRDSSSTVGGSASTHVGKNERHDVTDTADVTVGEELTTHVNGCYTVVVGAPEAKRSFVVHAEGLSEVSGSERLVLRTEGELLLQCGNSTIRLSPEGIFLRAKTVTLDGSDSQLALSEQAVRLSLGLRDSASCSNGRGKRQKEAERQGLHG